MTTESTSTFHEEDIYAAALSELESGATRPGLWAKAFAESEGDEPKSKALYIKLRVQQEKDRIQQEHKSAQAIAAEFAQRKAAAFSSLLSHLNLQGYHTTKSGTGWIVREPLGGRVKLSSDDFLLEYAKGRVEVPTELLDPKRMHEQAHPMRDESHSTSSSPTPSIVAFGNADNAVTANSMFGFLRFIRGICGFLFAMQIIGLFPVLTWLQQPDAITGNMLAQVFIKVVASAIFGALFFWLRNLINRLYAKKHGTMHPDLVKQWAL